jgi:hypothetical protein
MVLLDRKDSWEYRGVQEHRELPEVLGPRVLRVLRVPQVILDLKVEEEFLERKVHKESRVLL